MSILIYTRQEIEEKILVGGWHKASLRHYEICKALAEGKTQADIAEKFDVSDSRVVRFIKDKKCPECGNTRKH